MGRAAALEDVEAAAPFAGRFDHADEDPGVHERGNADLAPLDGNSAAAVRLVNTDVTLRFLRWPMIRVSMAPDVVRVAEIAQTRDGIDDHGRRPEPVHGPVEAEQMAFQAVIVRAEGAAAD